MNDLKVFHITGWFGLAGVLLLALEIPLWIIPGKTTFNQRRNWA